MEAPLVADPHNGNITTDTDRDTQPEVISVTTGQPHQPSCKDKVWKIIFEIVPLE